MFHVREPLNPTFAFVHSVEKLQHLAANACFFDSSGSIGVFS